MLTLETPKDARQLKLTLTAAGADLAVYATNDETIPDSLHGGWRELGTADDAAEQLTLKLSGGPQRHYLIWFTNLPPAGAGYRIGIAEAGLRS